MINLVKKYPYSCFVGSVILLAMTFCLHILYNKHQEQQTIFAIENSGAEVETEVWGENYWLMICESPPAWSPRTLLEVYAKDKNHCQDWLPLIVHASSLKRLNLNYTKGVTDEQLKYLQSLNSLTHLEISGTDVVGPGFVYISKLPNLEDIWIDDSNITDEALKHISKLPNLGDLLLSENPNVTEKGLHELAKSRSLRSITIGIHDNITNESLKKLQKKMPNCFVDY